MAQVIIYVVLSMIVCWDNLKEYLLCCQCWLSWTVVCYNLKRLYILMIQSDPSVDDILVGAKVFNYFNQCCLVSQQKRNNNHIWICCPWNYFLLLEYLNELIFFIYLYPFLLFYMHHFIVSFLVLSNYKLLCHQEMCVCKCSLKVLIFEEHNDIIFKGYYVIYY